VKCVKFNTNFLTV